jgi:membrane-associated phospholipid phosphatase
MRAVIINTSRILAILLFSPAAFAQSVDSVALTKHYHVNHFTGILIMAGGLATDAFAIGRIQDKPNLSAAEITDLNTAIINPIDRWALKQDPSKHEMFGKLSDEAEPPMFVILPALLGLDKTIRKDWSDILYMYLEGHVITFTVYNYSWLGPTFQNRFRPLTYYTSLPMADRMSGNNRNSFYSGHVASTAFTSFFVAKVYCDYHPELGGKKFLIYAAALVPPVFMGYIRVKALAHFPSDDMVGLTVGAALGIIIPEVHKFHYKGLSLGAYCPPHVIGLSAFLTLPEHKASNTFNLNAKSLAFSK